MKSIKPIALCLVFLMLPAIAPAEFLTIAGIDFNPVWYFYTNSILRDRLDALTDMVF